MFVSPFNFLSSVEAETPTGIYGWAKRLVETFQKWRLTDLIGQPLEGHEGQVIRVKADAGGYEHADASKVISASADYTEETTYGDVVIFGTGPITITLPTAVGNKATFSVKSVSGTVTLDPAGAETIDGLTTSLPIPWGASAQLRSDGANWWTF